MSAAHGKADRALGETGAADEMVVGRPDQEPVPVLLAPAGHELGQHQALGRPELEGFLGVPAAAESSLRADGAPWIERELPGGQSGMSQPPAS